MTGFVLGDGLSKARSLSDQPASCPLCGAILRQSRNLRRHLELLHFGLGNGSKTGVHPRHRRPDRPNDFALSSALACARPTARIDSHLARASEASDFPMMTPLSSIASSVSSASSVSLPGEKKREPPVAPERVVLLEKFRSRWVSCAKSVARQVSLEKKKKVVLETHSESFSRGFTLSRGSLEKSVLGKLYTRRKVLSEKFYSTRFIRKVSFGKSCHKVFYSRLVLSFAQLELRNALPQSCYRCKVSF